MSIGSPPTLLKVTEVSRRLNLSRSAVYSLIDRGELGYCKIGKSRRIPAEAVDKLIQATSVGLEMEAADTT